MEPALGGTFFYRDHDTYGPVLWITSTIHTTQHTPCSQNNSTNVVSHELRWEKMYSWHSADPLPVRSLHPISIVTLHRFRCSPNVRAKPVAIRSPDTLALPGWSLLPWTGPPSWLPQMLVVLSDVDFQCHGLSMVFWEIAASADRPSSPTRLKCKIR